jgi:DNA polymerase III delta subunit
MSDVDLLLVHGDDGFQIDQALVAFAASLAIADRSEVIPERSPDEAAIDRARLEAASVGLFGAHLAVLRQPLKAAGRSSAAADRLVALVSELPAGAALALAELRPSRDIGRPPALLARLIDAVRRRGGAIAENNAPRRAELAGWIARHAAAERIAIDRGAIALLAERIGGDIWESDVERGEQTRVADAELRKLATYAGERSIGREDVAALTGDTRPASVFAITNAVDRRDPAAAARALARALDEGEPPLRILASLAGRVSDLIVARDLSARRATPGEISRRVGRGNPRAAERIVEAARRYRGEELEAMLRGLFEADLAIKQNELEPEPAIAAWLGQHVLGAERRATRD